ncbi:MAG TPA: heparinase II/III family protein [Planctomycetota bacterium]
MSSPPLVAAVLSALLLAACSGSGGSGAPAPVPVEHPALLLRADDHAALRARRGTSPWRELADEALRVAREEDFDPLASDFDAFRRMTDLCGALGLALVLEPGPAHLAKLVATLEAWEDYFLGLAPPGSGVLVRWQQSAMFHAILALDVAHDALDPDVRARLEGMLDGMVRTWWRELAQDGTTSTPGLVGLWALYRGDGALAAAASALFRQRLFDELAPSGVFDSGSGYAWVRQGGDRTSKYLLIDVLEHTGRDRTLYGDPRLVALHEWMYQGAYTPARTNPTFGDSDPTRPVEALQGYPQPYRAHRFSAQAGRNAAWLVRDVAPRPLLATYVLLDDEVPVPEPPVSRVFGDSATLWEDGARADALQAVLWSARTESSHSHFDVNAVHLAAYGRDVLRNAGYCGSGVGIDATFDWDWVSARARSGNTVLLGGTEHVSKAGGGVVEGLTARGFDHASARSGAALAGGTHRRNLWLVHGEPDAPGYFVLLDEVSSAASDVELELLLHPDTDLVATRTADEAFEATLGAGTGAPVGLTLFLATPPLATELLPGGLCAFDDKEYVGQYLSATYSTGSARAVRALTVLFPFDAGHAEPLHARLAGPGFTGARLAFASGVEDVLLESAGTSVLAPGPESVRAVGAWFRRRGGAVASYFLARGLRFDAGTTPALGLASSAELTILVRGTEVHVTSAGATVTFDEPLLTGSVFSSAVGTVLSAAPGRVQLALNPGTFAFDLETGLALP